MCSAKVCLCMSDITFNVVAWVQVGHMVLHNVRKVSVRKHALLGGSGGMLPPGKF